jgi:8-oxo-dGTP diphosphatase
VFQIIDLTFTLAFLTNEDQILMLKRNNPPNKGKWNGVGGRIETGESPYQSVLREIEEETGLVLDRLTFGGIMTWEGFEIKSGGLYIFSANVDEKYVIANGEGILNWQSRAFAFNHPEVVDNIHYFLPPVLAGSNPLHYHFVYENGIIVDRSVRTLPNSIQIHQTPIG